MQLLSWLAVIDSVTFSRRTRQDMVHSNWTEFANLRAWRTLRHSRGMDCLFHGAIYPRRYQDPVLGRT